MNIPSWLESTWARLQDNLRRNLLAHALLFKGREGYGKRDFAGWLIASLLCEERLPDGMACEQCRGCALRKAGSHPDYLQIAPLDSAKSIGIDQIRQLGDFFALRSHYGNYKVVLIDPADLMQRAAANSLLKILEEPPAGGVILLVSDRPELLLPTLRSRCQQHALDRVSVGELTSRIHSPPELEALARAGGSPLKLNNFLEPELKRALDLLPQLMLRVIRGQASASVAATHFSTLGSLLLSDQMQRVIYETLLLKSGAALPLSEAGRPQSQDLQALADTTNSLELSDFVLKAMEVKRVRLTSLAAREPDLVERLWLEWGETRL